MGSLNALTLLGDVSIKFTGIAAHAEYCSNSLLKYRQQIFEFKGLSSIYPVAILLGFIPTGFGAAAALQDQTYVCWVLTALLIHCCIYLLGKVITFSICMYLDKIFLKSAFFYEENAEQIYNIAFTICANQSNPVILMSIKAGWEVTWENLKKVPLRKEKFLIQAKTRWLDLLFAFPIHAIPMAGMCIAVGVLLFQGEKADGFGPSAFGQNVCMVCLVPIMVILPLVSTFAEFEESKMKVKAEPIDDLASRQERMFQELAALANGSPSNVKMVDDLLDCFIKHDIMISNRISEQVGHVLRRPKLKFLSKQEVEKKKLAIKIMARLNASYRYPGYRQSTISLPDFPSNPIHPYPSRASALSAHL
ncbi:hypothetical protein DM01DRAFT_1335966 [Hesseltinella vesiculosa]|uniref:Uncharacterized protein n=1 Tax=Hesseltinella vesiculosa TaxID=101127 RepID=A0A1X2GHY4_9FUNG|nr:hypothetical protein DM01DRAFT_1335966 [Hesseltinella vesiculosa]